jgi:heavy metal translocating P-type ATPase
MDTLEKNAQVTTEPSSSAPYWAEELDPRHARFRARIGGLHCSLCTGTLEKALGRLPGVEHVAVSLTHEQALVEYDPTVIRPDDLLETLRDIGYQIWDPRKLRPFEEEEAALVREGKRLLTAIGFSLLTIALILQITGIWSLIVSVVIGVSLLVTAFLILRGQGLWRAIASVTVLGLLIAAVLVVNALGLARAAIPWVVGAFAIIVVFGVAQHILLMAWQSLRRGILNQHVMLEAGAFAGIVGGLIGLIARPAGYPTAPFFAVSVLIVNYHIFSEWLSLLVKTRSSQAVKRLLDLQPDTARVVRRDQEREVPIGEVVVSDLVRVRPGERIPVDGVVVSGHSAVDQALVTGEPVPLEKQQGDQVIGGSINGTGTLLIKVTAVGAESFLQQVIRHVEDARALKPGILHLVDRILRVYTPTVLALSLLSVVGWILGTALATGHSDVERAVFAGLSVLVMGYPCAVGIAAPLAIVRGAGLAADQGIIMRTGEAFQAFRQVTRIVLDKTGTLTVGKPTVQEIETEGDADALLAVAAAAEASSEHPLAQAVLSAVLDRGLHLPEVSDFESLTGLGVQAHIQDTQVLVGRPGFLEDRGIDLAPLAQRIATLEEAGRTVIVVSQNEHLLGAIALCDELRADAVETITAMRHAGLTPILVTGDNPRAASWVEHAVGIDDVRAGILPGQKAEIVRQLQGKGRRRVAMVGDGINDAPALMQADVGVAMGSGTDIAIESSDIIIVSNRLLSVLTAREISRRSYRKTRQNVVLAFLFNGIGVPLATTGLVYPVWAMVAMALSVTTIFVNSLWGRPDLLFDAIRSVGRTAPTEEHLPAA